MNAWPPPWTHRAALAATLGLAACGDDTAMTASGTATDSDSTTAGPTATDPSMSGSESGVTASDPTMTGGSSSDSESDPTCVSAGCETTTATGETETETATETATETGPSTETETGVTVTDTDTDTETTGEPCEGPECCEAEAVFCKDVCCAVGDVCSFQVCVAPGDVCEASSDCSEGDYCDFTLGEPEMKPPDPMCMGGVELPTGKCLPKPPLCGPNDPPQDPNDPDCLQSCTYEPTSDFATEVKHSWGGVVDAPYSSDIMMAPIVIQLDDDDCDGKITERDIPEIVFSTFSSGAYKNAGVLHAISIVDGAVVEKWSVPGVLQATKQLAGGDIDGEPGNEIVGCGQDGSPRAFTGDGQLLWTAPALTCLMPSIADLDSDGAPEVIVEGAILNGATGAIKANFSEPLASSFIVSDLDDDGQLDIITGSQGFHADGSKFVDTGVANQSSFYGTTDWKSPWPAIADFDGDSLPEVVVVDNLNHALSVWRYDANLPGSYEIVRAPVDINGGLNPGICGNGWGATHGGGPPTVADFDGDGTPDVGTAGGIGYAVLSGAALMDANVPGPATVVWIKQTTDCSSASTGSSVFDFDGDGRAEVVYSDQNRLRVYDGATGDILVERCNTTATLIEYPLVADVDNDGQADIVVVSNAYAKNSPQISCVENGVNGQSGVRVFGPAAGEWVRTRRVWNQHAYHVTKDAPLAQSPSEAANSGDYVPRDTTREGLAVRDLVASRSAA